MGNINSRNPHGEAKAKITVFIKFIYSGKIFFLKPVTRFSLDQIWELFAAIRLLLLASEQLLRSKSALLMSAVQTVECFSLRFSSLLIHVVQVWTAYILATSIDPLSFKLTLLLWRIWRVGWSKRKIWTAVLSFCQITYFLPKSLMILLYWLLQRT